MRKHHRLAHTFARVGAGAASLVGFACDRSAPAAPPSPTVATIPALHPPASPKVVVAGVGNFAQISPHLYRGAQPTPEGFRELEKMGIKTVINLRALHDDKNALRGTQLRYLRLRCNAWHPEQEDVEAFLQLAANPENWPIFVHCQHGADRTGMMVATYRMVVQSWTLEAAIAELPEFGFHELFATIRRYLRKMDIQKLHHAATVPLPVQKQ